MSEVNYASGTGICGKCGQQLLQLEEDGSKLCIVCKSKKLISEGPQVKAAVPTEEQMAKTLAAAGIAAGQLMKGSAPQASSSAQVVTAMPAPAQALPFKLSVEMALNIMRALPMPKDVKQFKTISRIITQMESLIQEK